MNTYHKIQNVFLRDPETKYKTLLEGQYAKPEFEYLKDNEWVFTEKVDGMNIRIQFNGELSYKGKTDNAQLHRDLVQRLHDLFDSKLSLFKENFVAPEGKETAVCFYGEGYGAGIQKGGCYRPDKDFVLFDIKIGDWWLQRKDVENVAEKFEIDVVPVVGIGSLSKAVGMTRYSFKSRWGDFSAEGLVCRPSTELVCRNGKRVITKIKYKDFRK